MIRLDKYLSDLHLGTRSQAKEMIRGGMVTVDGVKVLRPELKIDEERARVCCKGMVCRYEKYHYYMLNKPRGVVSATRDEDCDTVVDLLEDSGAQGLFPVGRLDKDTEGLLLITDDGQLAHSLLSPARQVPKTYEAELLHPLTPEEKTLLEREVDIGDEKPARAAVVEKVWDSCLRLTITEGRFHQVKRMLHAVGNEVTSLKRVSMGPLKLDETLRPGEYRQLTGEERESLSTYRRDTNR